MSCDKVSRRLRRVRAAIQVKKQVRICKYYNATIDSVIGVFRKRHALNCGRAHCMMCCNPRRTWGRITLAEVKISQAFRYDLLFV